MSERTFSLEEIAALLKLALDRPTADNGEEVFTLEEVAAMTKMSLRQIEKDCRAERVEHVHQGQLRGMTRKHIAGLVNYYTVQAKAAAKTPAELEREEAAATRRALAASTARASRRRAA